MNLGSIFLTLLADGSKLGPQVQDEAQKAGDAGAKTLGQRLGGALKTDGLKLFGAAATGAFALATAGALKLEDATARFRAETGATADEAERMGKTINKVAGDERMSLDAVTDIAIRVKRDLGAAGAEADDLTASIAKFARVTHQDGGQAVEALDDIMDNWDLTLKDAKGLMDKLVVSQQRWGGNLQENESTLAKLAPAMKAANFQIDDGIALLGLFGAKGLNSERAAAAFSKALTKVKSPEELKRLIKDIQDTEDPFKRAEKAADLFGAKAGAQLANALGGANLDDYKVSIEDAAGATEKAAEVIDTTVTGRIAKAFSQAGAALRGFGAEFGPVTQGIAGLASLGVTLGGGKLLRGITTGLLKPAVGLGVRVVTTIAQGVASNAAVNALAGGISGAVNRIPGRGVLKSGLNKVGGFLGSTLGKAMGIAAGVAFAIWLADEIQKQRDNIAAQAKGIGESIGSQIKGGTTEQLEQTLAALKSGIDAIVAETNRNGFITLANPQQLDALQALVDQYNIVQTELNRRAGVAAQVQADALKNAIPDTRAAAEQLTDQLPTVLEKRQAETRGAVERWLNMSIGEQLVKLGPEAVRAGAETSLGLAQGIRDKRSAIKSAVQQLRTSIENAIRPRKEIGQDIGLLMGRAIRKGLKSADPEVRAQAEGTRALIEARLIELVKSGGKAGQDVLDELAKKMKSKDPAVRNQAERTKSVIDAALKAQPAKTPGDVIGDQLNTDLKDKGTTLGRTAYDLGRTIARNLVAGVKGTGPVPPSGSGGTQPPTHRQNQPEFAEGSWYVPATGQALVHRGEIVVPQEPAAAIRAGNAYLGTAPQAPLIGQLSIDARGATNPAATGAAVRQAVADAMADALRTQTARLPVGTRS